MVYNLDIGIGIGQWFVVSISLISNVNIGHISNIVSDIGRYYKVNIVSQNPLRYCQYILEPDLETMLPAFQ